MLGQRAHAAGERPLPWHHQPIGAGHDLGVVHGPQGLLQTLDAGLELGNGADLLLARLFRDRKSVV